MRGQDLTRGAALGLAFGAAICAVVHEWIHRPVLGGLAAGALDAALVAIVAAAWRTGRSRSGAASCRHTAARDEVGEEVVRERDAAGRPAHASPQCLELPGCAPEEARSLSLSGVARPDEHAVARADARGRFHGLLGGSRAVGEGPPCEAARTSAAIRRVLADDGLQTAFQPIVSLPDGRVVGVEALSRFTVADEGRTTEDWFTDAARVGLGADLEIHAARQALHLATTLPVDAYVSVNLSPQTLLWPGLPDALRGAPIPLSRIVVELTEHSAVEDYDALGRALHPLREAGLRIAVDDAGAGYATFRHVLRLAPDLIKLDRSLISGIDGDPARRALAGAFVAFAREMRGVVVAEGIERAAELAVVADLGVDAGQGYLFSRPSTDERDWREWHCSRWQHRATAGSSASPLLRPAWS